jgi:hypothetical protein
MPHGIRIANPRVIINHVAALALAAAALLASASAWADPPGRVGRIAEATGTVWVFDGVEGEWIAAQRNRPVTSGDRLSAERDARAELQIGSATLRLDSDTELEVTQLDDAQVRLHLHHGSLALRLRSAESVHEFSVTTDEGRFDPQRVGHYRIDAEDNGSFGGVIAGAMRFEARDSALELGAGQRAEFWNENGVTHYTWSSLPGDRFADWVARQDQADDRMARSRTYVSPEMTGAEDLDRYGDWDRHPEYGALWYPRQVAPGWAPYRYGHWAYVSPWGYTWVDDAPWGFAPFHYGRWVSWQGRWAWAPGQYVARPVYAPALVAWIGGPNVSVGINIGGGPAVGWVPLSPREVYRPHYQVTNVYVTKINSPYRRWHQPNQPVRTGPIMYTNQGVPGGVTVVSQNVLRERRPINNAVIAPVDSRSVQRWQSQRGDDRRPQNFVPPAPTARVIAVPGGAVPAAPGAARNTPWGQARGQRPAAQANPQVAPQVHNDRDRNNADNRVEQQRGRPPLADPRGQRPPAVEQPRIAPVAPAVTTAPQREQQDRRPGRDNERGERRWATPAQPDAAAPAPQVVQPVRGVRAAPPQAAPAAQDGERPGRAAAPERGNRRERGQNDANDRDDRQPPGQERRREWRQQQNN